MQAQGAPPVIQIFFGYFQETKTHTFSHFLEKYAPQQNKEHPEEYDQIQDQHNHPVTQYS